MKKFFLVILVGVVLFANQCFAASTVIKNYTVSELKNTLVRFFIQNGGTIKESTDYTLVVRKQGSFLSTLLLGRGYSNYAEEQIEFNFVQDEQNVIMTTRANYVVDAGSVYERFIPLNANNEELLISNFDKALNGYYAYGYSWQKRRKYMEVTKSDNENLKIGDKVIEINEKTVSEMSKDEIDRKVRVSEIGKELKIKYIRNNEEKETIIKSKFIPALIKKSVQ